MLDKFKKLPLRKGVGIVLLNQNNEVFVAIWMKLILYSNYTDYLLRKN